ncbi:PP2C family protein-serine/threonine phosphatase [Xanthobacter variabilis]|uniref:PP2C family protein-serine/threonine phosphatase n=1 Tax=Xanthobacter variabilis TaxID=3119932 RepID=UPI0037276642
MTLRDRPPSPPAPPELAFRASAATRIGPRHPQNEDAHLVSEGAGLFAVSDGIGGLAEGEVASRAVVELLHRGVTANASLDARVAQAHDALYRANAALFQAGEESQRPMGATVVAALLGEGCAVCLWAGDSRAYLARAGALHPVTHDHAILGRTSRNGPPRTLVTRAIGPDEAVDIDCTIVELQPGDTLLLCSDGVYGAIGDARLETLLGATPPADAEEVVAEAVARGTRDDATAIVIAIRPAGAAHVSPR